MASTSLQSIHLTLDIRLTSQLISLSFPCMLGHHVALEHDAEQTTKWLPLWWFFFLQFMCKIGYFDIHFVFPLRLYVYVFYEVKLFRVCKWAFQTSCEFKWPFLKSHVWVNYANELFIPFVSSVCKWTFYSICEFSMEMSLFILRVSSVCKWTFYSICEFNVQPNRLLHLWVQLIGYITLLVNYYHRSLRNRVISRHIHS